MRTILVISGAGLIGSAVVWEIIQHTVDHVAVVDRLTHANNLMSLAPAAQDARFTFEQVDVCDRGELDRTSRQYRPDTMMCLVAESHVDRSIDSPATFIEINILGTYTLLEATRSRWDALATEKKSMFRFHHISVDEVYGDLRGNEDFFTKTTPYMPSNPCPASEASSDHPVRAWLQTYGLPMLIANCSNNYGPYHSPEGLIPLAILSMLAGKPLPVYGDGQRIHDWLYVENHARALYLVATRGEPGGTYNIGGHSERRNIEVVEIICQLLEELVSHKPRSVMHYHDLITFVADRPGRDLRCVINASKTTRELGRTSAETFASGIRKTVV